MEYFKTLDGTGAVWLQSPTAAWVVTIYPALQVSTIKCECGPDSGKWARATLSGLEPCTEAEFTEIYNRAIQHQRNYRKGVTV